MNSPQNHELNQGRESLWELELDTLYLVEGNASGVFSTMKDNVSRYALSEVLIKPYDVSKQYAELPVVAWCQHTNCIRKDDNMEYSQWDNGRRQYLIGKVEEYTTKGVERRSIKVFRDSNLPKELQTIEKRIRSLNNAWTSITDDEKHIRMRKTLSLIERASTMVETYMFVPFVPKPVLLARVQKCQVEMKRLATLLQ